MKIALIHHIECLSLMWRSNVHFVTVYINHYFLALLEQNVYTQNEVLFVVGNVYFLFLRQILVYFGCFFHV